MEKNKSNLIKKLVKTAFNTDDIFWNNEVQSNMLVATTMLISSIVLGICWLLNLIGIFSTGSAMNSVSEIGIIALLSTSVLCFAFKGKKVWLKYLMMTILITIFAMLDCALSFNVILIMAVPVVLSCRYASKHFTIQVGIFTALAFGISAYANSFMGLGRMDLNHYAVNPGTVLNIETTLRDAIEKSGIDLYVRGTGYILRGFLPRIIIFSVLTLICVFIANRARNMVLEQADISHKNARISSELSLATDIQANMLPRIFPAFPEHDEIDIFATMNPAKEVGGDFYDFFMIDDSNVAVVIGDVSGKGVPAALFMVTAKTLIKDHSQLGLEPAEVFTRINKILCDGNDAGLFVTGWMGVLNLKSGILKYVNAGHNPPVIKNGDGEFKYLVSRPGFVLAGMDTVKYKQSELQMYPGDKLYLYTDGVTEATSTDKKLYGEDRLINYINAHGTEIGSVLLKGIRKDIDTFVGDAEQFDDITMLYLEFIKKAGEDSVEASFPATNSALQEIISFIEGELEKREIPIKEKMQISMATEEIFTNIADYAYPGRTGNVKIEIKIQDNTISISYKDSGIPFNPLSKDDPDIHTSVEERNIKGIGILMVKKTMDDVSYQYKDGMNILTIVKKYA